MFIKSISSEQNSFDPVKFHRGINIITGERTQISSNTTKSEQKTNGVGKTILLNLIDFCLLTEYNSSSRIFKIPNDVLPPSDNIILELDVNGRSIQVRRSRSRASSPVIFDGTTNHFTSLNEARQYLYSLVFGHKGDKFRSYLRPFRRKEIVGFNKIDNPDGLPKVDASPYLRIFGVDIDLYESLTKQVAIVDENSKEEKTAKKNIELLGVSTEEAEAYKNGLRAKVERLNATVEELSHKDVYDTISEDISNLDRQIKATNNNLISIKKEIAQLENFPEHEDINLSDIQFVFNDCKDQLGDVIVKNIEEVQEFKKAIDSFKLNIITKRKVKLISEKEEIIQKLKVLSKNYDKKISVLNKDGSLKSLKTAIHEYTQVHDEYCEISFLHDQYIDLKNNLEYAQKRRDDILFDLDQNIKKQNLVVSSFSNKILELHHVLYGNKAASFAIEVKKPYAKKRKHFVFLHMEIDDSGSARSTHEKMLIFDFSLLFCPDTKKNHINMLIHVGAFEGINDDTKFQLFNWLHTHQENEECFQYIATINHDSFEALEEKQKFTFDLKSYVVAQYTKNNRLFRKKYAEK